MYLNKKININHLILFLSGAVLFLSPIRKLTSLFGFISLQQLIAAFVLLFFSISFFSGKIYYRKSLVYFISTIFLYDLFLFILHLSSSSLVEFSFIFDRYKFWLFAFILYSIIFTMKSEIFFGKIIILSSAFASSLGILVYFSNLDSLRAMSMLDFQMYRAGYGLEFDTNYFAAILSMSLPFHFNFQKYFSNLPGLFKQLQFYTIPVIMFTILLSLSRGAYVASFLIFFYYIFLALKKGKIKSRTIFLTGITVIIFAKYRNSVIE